MKFIPQLIPFLRTFIRRTFLEFRVSTRPSIRPKSVNITSFSGFIDQVEATTERRAVLRKRDMLFYRHTIDLG